MKASDIPRDPDRESFIQRLTEHGSYSHQETDRLESLWPAAERIAVEWACDISAVGFVSIHRPFKAFIKMCEKSDTLQRQRGLTDEQAQMALMILRMRHGRYRKAERMFVARAARLAEQEVPGLSHTAQQFLLAV